MDRHWEVGHPVSLARRGALRAMAPPALIGIVAIGIVLRVINLSGRPLWYDESFTVLYARLSYASMLEAPDVHPLLYYRSLATWTTIFGESVAGVRPLSAAYGAATIVLAYALMRELFDRRAALIAALFVALSPFQIAFSQEARMYAQLGFWSTVALWAFARGARTNSWKAWLAFGLCGAAMLYTHNLAFIFLAALGLFVVVRFVMGLTQRVVRTALLAGTLTSGLVMSALFSPWLPTMLAQLGGVSRAYWIAPPNAVTFVQTLTAFGFWTDNQAAAPPLAVAMLAGSLLILALIGHELILRLRSGQVRRRREFDARVGLLVTLFLVPIVALALVSYLLKPVYIIRGLMPAQIAFLLLAAWAASKLPRVVQIGAGALLGAVLVFALAAHYTYTGFPRAPWSDVAATLRANVVAGDAIIHDNKLTFFPMRVVDPALEQAYLPDLAGIGSDTLAPATQKVLGLSATDVNDAIASRERVWLVIFSRTRGDYRAAGLGDDPNWTALDAQFDVVEQRSFGDLELFLWMRSDR